MAKDDGLGLHPLTHVVNVHWGGGLAVEFFDGAGGEKEQDEADEAATA